jgi:hypothetical protein
MRGVGAIMILVALIVGLLPLMSGADGDDSPAECELAYKLEVAEGSPAARQATVKAPEGYVIDAICIKSGEEAFGDLKHSALITADGVYSGFTVVGLGTERVTVTAGAGIKDISHVDYSKVKEAPKESRVRFEKVWVGEIDEIADFEVMVTVTYTLDGVEYQTTFAEKSEWITVPAGKTLTYESESVDLGEGVNSCDFKKEGISYHSFTAPYKYSKDKSITITNKVWCDEPEPEPIFLSLEKVWTGAEFDETDLVVTLLMDGEVGPVEVEDGQSVVITENVTGLPETCTYRSDIVSPYVVDSEDADDGVITVRVTNHVTCVVPEDKKDEVLPVVVTTSTAPTTTIPTKVLPIEVTTTIESEVVGSVVAETLPFTGSNDLGWLLIAAEAVALGSVLVIGSRREESEL